MSEHPPGKRERKKRALHEQLYGAAIAAFERDGYDRVSVDAICAEVGVAKGTFFKHFPSKAAVVAAWYQGNLERSLGERTATEQDPYLAPVLAMVEQMRLHPRLWQAKNALAATDPALAQAEVNGDRALRRHYARLIEHASPTKSGEPMNAEELAEMVVSQITGTCREWTVEQTAAAESFEIAVNSLRCRLDARIALFVGLAGLTYPS